MIIGSRCPNINSETKIVDINLYMGTEIITIKLTFINPQEFFCEFVSQE